MPWKACKPMDERLKFIARVLDGEKMAPLCREFSISRKTGYKILRRYNDSGLQPSQIDRAGLSPRLTGVRHCCTGTACGSQGKLLGGVHM